MSKINVGRTLRLLSDTEESPIRSKQVRDCLTVAYDAYGKARDADDPREAYRYLGSLHMLVIDAMLHMRPSAANEAVMPILADCLGTIAAKRVEVGHHIRATEPEPAKGLFA